MNFDIEQAKELLKIFGRLSAENQEELLVTATRLEIEQGLKTQIINSGETPIESTLQNRKSNYVNVLSPLMEHWDEMGPNHRAALAMIMNEMTKGELTKEEYIDFVIRSRQLSISEYIEKYIPGADINEAAKIYRSLKEVG